MQVKNSLIKLAVAAVILFPWVASAQTSSINAFSPYTMYGIGEINTPGTMPMRSMGGVGVAMRSGGLVNLLNPAAYSAAPAKTFLFNFGLEGQNFYNSQQVEGASKSTAYNSFNFHDIAFQLPLAPKIGLAFSLTPYSSVGYRNSLMATFDPNDPVWGNVGPVQYTYQGEGDLTEVKLGVGWEPFRNFSVGVALQYYWGDIDRTFTMMPTAVTGAGSFSGAIGTDNYGISSIKGQIGVQWNALIDTQKKRALTLGAVYDFGGDLNPSVTKSITVNNLYSSVVRDDATHLPLVLPHRISAGLFYQTEKVAVGLDYVFEDWGSRNSRVEQTGLSGSAGNSFEVAYTNTSTIKAGVEYVPNRYDVRSFLKRWSYRAGFRYGTHNQSFGGHKLSQYAVTLGLGIPVKFLAVSGVDVGFEYGRRGYNLSKELGLVRQQYFKVSVGFTLFAGSENGEYWFLRPKYD